MKWCLIFLGLNGVMYQEPRRCYLYILVTFITIEIKIATENAGKFKKLKSEDLSN